ncbi:hypothetical protein KP509_13G010400 [Ceratopteris richardii]|uniref:Uncharacterized protein n=1 Tax=Ceratopteris richardii TaxID=49495 RepID=A0A8T2TBD4_CERRI|nr:hypothetical protein KP509_13G010400 [Ceratopteris richardii]
MSPTGCNGPLPYLLSVKIQNIASGDASPNSLALLKRSSIEEKKISTHGLLGLINRAPLLSVLLELSLLVWSSGALHPEASAEHDSATNVSRSVNNLIRPHPPGWRLVHGIVVVYLLFLSFHILVSR